jgi:hypothetical protein
MPVDIVTLASVGGAVAAFLMPVYGALWKINGTIGAVRAKTEHNETALEDVSDAVNRIEGAVAESDAVDLRAANS